MLFLITVNTQTKNGSNFLNMSELSSISCSAQHPFAYGTGPTHCVSIAGQTGQSVF